MIAKILNPGLRNTLALATCLIACAGAHANNTVLLEENFVEGQTGWPADWTIFRGGNCLFLEARPDGDALHYHGTVHGCGDGGNTPRMAWINEESLGWSSYRVSMRFSTDFWSPTTSTYGSLLGRVQSDSAKYQVQMRGASLRILRDTTVIAQSTPDIVYDPDAREIWTLRATFLGPRIFAEVFNADDELVTSVVAEDDTYPTGAPGFGASVSGEISWYQIMVEEVTPNIPVDEVTAREAIELEIPTVTDQIYDLHASADLKEWWNLDNFEGDGATHYRLLSIFGRDREFYKVNQTQIGVD